MKNIKSYFIVVGGLLFCSLAAGVVVWILVLWLVGTPPAFESEAIDAPSAASASDVAASAAEDALVNKEAVPTIVESETISLETEANAVESEPNDVVIDTGSLNKTQRTVLKTFGFEGEDIVITPSMLECIELKIDGPRLDEIVAGGAPSPLEALALFGCIK